MVSSPLVSRKQGIKQRGEKNGCFCTTFLHKLAFFLALNPAPTAIQSRCGRVVSCKFTPLEGNWTSSLAWTMFLAFSFLFLNPETETKEKKKSVAVLRVFFPCLDNLTCAQSPVAFRLRPVPPTIPPSSNLRCEFLPNQRWEKKPSENWSLLRSFNVCCQIEVVFPV